jgi:hypothetical protein
MRRYNATCAEVSPVSLSGVELTRHCRLKAAPVTSTRLKELLLSGPRTNLNGSTVLFGIAPSTTFRHDTAQSIHSTQLGNTVTKDELRAELERQEQRYKDVYGGEVTTYAAQPEPERKPWRKRASLLDQAFAQEIQKIEQELKTEEP